MCIAITMLSSLTSNIHCDMYVVICMLEMEGVWRIQLQSVQNLIAILLQIYQVLNIILCVVE